MKKRTVERHATFFNLSDALSEKGCALCSLTAKAAHDYLNGVLYESVTDAGTRKAFAASLGVCPTHARLASQMKDALGIAIIYESLCRDVANRIENGETPCVGKCPVCRAVAETEERYLSEFGARIGESDFQETFRSSDGFCLVHYGMVILALRDKNAHAIVQSHHASILRSLAEQLKLFIEKHDYKKSAEFGAEADAWLRALDKFVGKMR